MRKWILLPILVATIWIAGTWRPEKGETVLWVLLGLGAVAALLVTKGAPVDALRREEEPSKLVLGNEAAVPSQAGLSPSDQDSPALKAGQVRESRLGLLGLALVAAGFTLHSRGMPMAGLVAWILATAALWRTRVGVMDGPRWLAGGRGQALLVVWALIAVVLLPAFWKTPDSLYNWEEYTVGGLLGTYRGEYRPDGGEVPYGMIYAPWKLLELSIPFNQGLMTDSYRVLLGGTPAAAAMRMFGVSLFSLRIYSVCMSLVAVVLFVWLVRSLSPDRRVLASICGIVLAGAPVFLVYGRTGTDVGPTLTWAILILVLIARVFWGKRRLMDALALGAAIGLSAYFYAVIRLQVLALLFWLFAMLIMRRFRPGLLRGLALVGGLILVLLPQLSKIEEVRESFLAGRGEQLIAMSESPDELRHFFPDEPLNPPFSWNLRLRYIARYMQLNLANWYRLFCGIDLHSAVSDYWNPTGEVLPQFLLVLALVGAIVSWRTLGFERASLLFVVFVSGACPSLMTNNVHAGRVLLALPAMIIWSGLAAMATAWWAGRILSAPRLISSLVFGSLALAVIWHHYEGFVRPMLQAGYPHRNYLRPVAEAAASSTDARLVVSPFPLEAAAFQFFLFPTHRIWFGDRPMIPTDVGPQPGPGVVQGLLVECENSDTMLLPPGDGMVFAKTTCIRRWMRSGIEPVSLPGTSDYMGFMESTEGSAANVMWLSETTPSATEYGFVPPKNDSSWEGGPMVMNGRTYFRGIGVHAWTRLTYDVPSNADRLKAMIGLSDEARECGGGRAQVQFFVRNQDGAVMFDSGMIKFDSHARPIDVDIAGATRVTLEVTEGENGADCDHANWGDVRIVLLAPGQQSVSPRATPVPPRPTPPPMEAVDSSSQVVWLSGLTPEQVEFSFAPPKMNVTWNDGPIEIGGVRHAHGIGMHATSSIRFAVPAGATQFRAIVGVSDQIRECERADVTFQIRDEQGSALFDSGIVTPRTPPLPVVLNLHAERSLVLAVGEGLNGGDCDHANWADASFIVPNATPSTPGSRDDH